MFRRGHAYFHNETKLSIDSPAHHGRMVTTQIEMVNQHVFRILAWERVGPNSGMYYVPNRSLEQKDRINLPIRFFRN